jgi:hypothetical protein
MTLFKKITVLILIFSFFALTSCSGVIDEADSTSTSDSIVSVENVIERTIRSGVEVDPYITVTIKNSGSDKIYELTISVTALNTVGSTISGPHSITITDFASSDELEVSEEIAFEVDFTGLSSHDDYDNIQFDFDWEVKKSGQVSTRLLY